MISWIKRDVAKTERQPGRLAASLVAIVSFVRSLPLFFSRRPRTPLRVLCLMAFDTVHVLRNRRRLSSDTLQTLATLLDFGACANDLFDDEDCSRQEYDETRRLFDRDPISEAVDDYCLRLRDLEDRRPSPGGDDRQHRKAQLYRESVIRLSLGMIAATALGHRTIDDGIEATHSDEDIESLYRIVMLCQIIDDVLDVATDTVHGLPSFLTAHTSPTHALALTSDAATRYADRRGWPASPHLFPFRVALVSVFVVAKLVLFFGHWRLRWHARQIGSVLISRRRGQAGV